MRRWHKVMERMEFVALRLENSDGCSGRLQVFYNGTWGNVCSNSMTPDTVSLVCKELGCGDGGSLEAGLPYGRVSGTAWLDYVQCEKGTSSFWQCPSTPWDPQSCDDLREETHITCNGSRTAQELFPEAVYEEIGHSPAWEKQARFGCSGSSSEQSLTQLQPYPGHREEEDGLGSAPDVPVLPGGDPVDGYDDAREVSLPGEDDTPGQRAREMPRMPEEGAGPSGAPREMPPNPLVIPKAIGDPTKPIGDPPSHCTLAIAYRTCIALYLCPSADVSLEKSRIVALLNTVLYPFLNPFIYSLRNKTVILALN
ncbi:hypothetical protein Q9966_016769 [Columba livia]|nr:hypothetical protein Q9966_016769 [Columba livia]